MISRSRSKKVRPACAWGRRFLGKGQGIDRLAPPAEGRANEACIEFLANLLKAPRSSVTIASGQSSRRKVIRVSGVSLDEVHKRLGI
ncbi:MAG: DUF167 domain-containing protein [Terriglobales bacterium]